jgi:hypothetical protein
MELSPIVYSNILIFFRINLIVFALELSLLEPEKEERIETLELVNVNFLNLNLILILS